MMPSNDSLPPEPKDTQFTVREEKRNQKKDHADPPKMTKTDESILKIAGD